MAASYSNIAGLYLSMREYSKSLSYHEKDLKFAKKLFDQTTLIWLLHAAL
jgi:hypothetical protein